jgi:hypothetical protein
MRGTAGILCSASRVWTDRAMCLSGGSANSAKSSGDNSPAHESKTWSNYREHESQRLLVNSYACMGARRRGVITWAPASTCPTRKSTQMSAIRARSFLLSCGCLNNHVLAFWSVFDPPPSTMYENSVHGAPQNPMSGTSPASPCRVRVMAAKT